MRYLVCMTTTTLALLACGGSQTASSSTTSSEAGATASGGGEGEPASAAQAEPEQSNEFVLRKSDADKTRETSGATASKIKPTKTEAAMKFVVIDKDKGPIRGIIIALTAPDGTKYYTEETNTEGYAEVLVPVGQKYELVYLSLGRKDIAASVPVSDEPNQNVKLTLRYKRYTPPPRPAAQATPDSPAQPAPGFILDAVTFDSGKATIRDASFPQLDGVAEYLTQKTSARIEISGHTDNVGNPKVNKSLSQKRAQSCRDYLISKGVEGERIQAVGYGDERPIASNDTDEGRQQNRRIEAVEL